MFFCEFEFSLKTVVLSLGKSFDEWLMVGERSGIYIESSPALKKGRQPVVGSSLFFLRAASVRKYNSVGKRARDPPFGKRESESSCDVEREE